MLLVVLVCNSSQPGILKVLQSVAAALLGVQSDRNANEDFKSSSPALFIIFGVVSVILLVLLLSLIVTKIASLENISMK